MKKYLIIISSILVVSILAVTSLSQTGLFSKAFSISLNPGEQAEKNITIRKYYNLTIRLQKENSTSYLSFDSPNSIITLKDSSGNEIASLFGLDNARSYLKLDRQVIDKISTVSATNLGSYKDVVDQQITPTFSGTTAYVTIKVAYKGSSLSGYVIDDLTNENIPNISISVFSSGQDPNFSSPVNETKSDSDGRYYFNFSSSQGSSFEVYTKDYETA